jgi:adenylate cyclase
MEKDVAILIADLSGYTALTETHGASGAADLIDIFMEIVNNCLVGDSYLHQRTGDEVLIISTSADHLMATAVLLLQKTSGKKNFLQIHGGLHYGKILRRNNDYFGTAINLTARIAAHANPGSFCCSSAFKDALAENEFKFVSKGNCQFKNISGENEIFELVIGHTGTFYIDPVCRMLVNEPKTAIRHPEEENVFFCSADCLEIYVRKTSLA